LESPTPDPANAFLPRIRAIAPELEIRTAVYNGNGLINDVVIVNDALVFRFPKDDYGRNALVGELAVLRALRPRIEVPIPHPFYTSPDAIAYERLPGETLSRELLLSLAPAAQQRLADELGGFLRGLHHTPVDETLPRTLAPSRREDWADMWRKIDESVLPISMDHQRVWATELFDRMLGDERAFDYEPRLIHGDLGPYHILCDQAAGRLTAILDFGVAGFGDPATDLGGLLQIYGERFVRRILGAYPEAQPYLPRARFYAEAIELQWVMRGLTSGESFWFTAHLGGARDLWADGPNE
jgi:aminoglycoside 2''-phosphotransferase